MQSRESGSYRNQMRRGGLTSNPQLLARSLGVLSIGFGLAEVVAHEESQNLSVSARIEVA